MTCRTHVYCKPESFCVFAVTSMFNVIPFCYNEFTLFVYVCVLSTQWWEEGRLYISVAVATRNSKSPPTRASKGVPQPFEDVCGHGSELAECLAGSGTEVSAWPEEEFSS